MPSLPNCVFTIFSAKVALWLSHCSLIFSHYLLIDWNHKKQVTSYRLQVLCSRWNWNEPHNWFTITLERAQKQWTLSDVNKSQVIIEF